MRPTIVPDWPENRKAGAYSVLLHADESRLAKSISGTGRGLVGCTCQTPPISDFQDETNPNAGGEKRVKLEN
jgi:hypothetical protein